MYTAMFTKYLINTISSVKLIVLLTEHVVSKMFVTFQDSLTFRTRNSFLQNVSRSEELKTGTQQGTTTCNKARRGINFATTCHQTRLARAKFSFTHHSQVNDYNRENESDKIKPQDFILPKLAEERDFVRKFQLKKPQDDTAWRSREWRLVMMIQPYENPKPFDHRGVSTFTAGKCSLFGSRAFKRNVCG